MAIKLFNILRRHDHWFAEWWSSVLLVIVGIYGVFVPSSEILHQSFIDGFLMILPSHLWECLFVGIGIFQFYMLYYETLIGRGFAAFFASSLLIWGFLNILFYGQWHFSLIAWGVFAAINLTALVRITMRIEKRHEPL